VVRKLKLPKIKAEAVKKAVKAAVKATSVGIDLAGGPGLKVAKAVTEAAVKEMAKPEEKEEAK
jgi:hypothetical protein